MLVKSTWAMSQESYERAILVGLEGLKKGNSESSVHHFEKILGGCLFRNHPKPSHIFESCCSVRKHTDFFDNISGDLGWESLVDESDLHIHSPTNRSIHASWAYLMNVWYIMCKMKIIMAQFWSTESGRDFSFFFSSIFPWVAFLSSRWI